MNKQESMVKNDIFQPKKEKSQISSKKTIDEIRIVKNLQNSLTRFEANVPIT